MRALLGKVRKKIMKTYKLHLNGGLCPSILIQAERVKVDNDSVLFFVREKGVDTIVNAFAPGTWHSFEEIKNASA